MSASPTTSATSASPVGLAPARADAIPERSCADLRAAGRNLDTPFVLRRANGERLLIEAVLRLLPGKRIAARARRIDCEGEARTGEGGNANKGAPGRDGSSGHSGHSDHDGADHHDHSKGGRSEAHGDLVFAKLFIGPQHARHCAREVAGLRLLSAARQPTPALIATEALEGGHLILSAFITNARTVEQRWQAFARRPAGDPAAVAVLAPIFRQLGTLHRAGLTHEDVHPGNFLMAENQLYVLDGDAVRHTGSEPVGSADALRNLGMLRAQLPMDWDDATACAPLLDAYREGCLAPTAAAASAPPPTPPTTPSSTTDDMTAPFPAQETPEPPQVFLRPRAAAAAPAVSPGHPPQNAGPSQVFLPLEERNERSVFFDEDARPGRASGIEHALRAATDRAREVRLTDYLRKIRRDCTLFQVDRRPGQFSVVLREYADALAPVLADPDAWIGRGTMLKNGRSATVVRITLDAAPLSTAGDSARPHHACPTADPTPSSPATSSQTSMPGGATSSPLVLKRYNLKSGLHALSRALRPSRAWHAWCAGHRLRLLGIPTPTPLAIIEERSGPLRGRAWLITEWCEGTRLIEHFGHDGARAPNEAEARALTALFTSLRRARITHGDLKAHNLFWQDGRLALIDLDAMVHHNRATADARAWHKDRARFLRNWPENSPLHRWLDTALPTERL